MACGTVSVGEGSQPGVLLDFRDNAGEALLRQCDGGVIRKGGQFHHEYMF